MPSNVYTFPILFRDLQSSSFFFNYSEFNIDIPPHRYSQSSYLWSPICMRVFHFARIYYLNSTWDSPKNISKKVWQSAGRTYFRSYKVWRNKLPFGICKLETFNVYDQGRATFIKCYAFACWYMKKTFGPKLPNLSFGFFGVPWSSFLFPNALKWRSSVMILPLTYHLAPEKNKTWAIEHNE